MPQTAIYFYQEKDKTVPVYDWLKEIRKKEPESLCALPEAH